MSHFTVLVVGQNPEAQLMPYQEFEYGGLENGYIEEQDRTEEWHTDYDTSTITVYQDQDGRIHRPWEEVEGEQFEPVEYAVKDCMSFTEYCVKYMQMATIQQGELPRLFLDCRNGYCILDESGQVAKVVVRTNPYAKYDWYELGGRWTGFFKLKEGATGRLGTRGNFTKPAREGYADQALKKDIDFSGMLEATRQELTQYYTTVHKLIDPFLPVTPFETLKQQYCLLKQGEPKLSGSLEELREAYNAQPAIQALRQANIYNEDLTSLLLPLAEYLDKEASYATLPYAFVQNGQWFGQGTMGWWCYERDVIDKAIYVSKFQTMFDSLSDDTMLSLYDCHI